MQRNNKLHDEGIIALALQEYIDGKHKSLRKAAASYGVCKTKLTRRYYKITSRRDTPPNSKKLTSTEEAVLLQRILDLDA